MAQLHPKQNICHSSITDHIILLTKPSFYSRSYGQHFSKIKFWNVSHMGRLWPYYWFWGKWTTNGLSGITLQSHIRFSQTSPYLVQRVAGIPFKPNNWENLGLLWVWDLMQCFSPIVPKAVYLTYLHDCSSNFYNHPIILFRTLSAMGVGSGIQLCCRKCCPMLVLRRQKNAVVKVFTYAVFLFRFYSAADNSWKI